MFKRLHITFMDKQKVTMLGLLKLHKIDSKGVGVEASRTYPAKIDPSTPPPPLPPSPADFMIYPGQSIVV